MHYARTSVGDNAGEYPVSWSGAYISRLGLGRGTGGVDMVADSCQVSLEFTFGEWTVGRIGGCHW